MRSSMLGLDAIHTITCIDIINLKSLCNRLNSHEGSEILKSLLQEMIVLKYICDECIETQYSPDDLKVFNRNVNYSLTFLKEDKKEDEVSIEELSFDDNITDIFDEFDDIDSDSTTVSQPVQSNNSDLLTFDDDDDFDSDFDDLDVVTSLDGYIKAPDGVEVTMKLSLMQLMKAIANIKPDCINDFEMSKIQEWLKHVKKVPTGRVFKPNVTNAEVNLNGFIDTKEYPELLNVFRKLKDTCEEQVELSTEETLPKIDAFIEVLKSTLNDLNYSKKLFEYSYFNLNHSSKYPLALRLNKILLRFEADSLLQTKKKYLSYIEEVRNLITSINKKDIFNDLSTEWSYEDFKSKIATKSILDGVAVNVETLDLLHLFVLSKTNSDSYFHELVSTNPRTLITFMLLMNQIHQFKNVTDIFDIDADDSLLIQMNEFLTNLFYLVGFHNMGENLLLNNFLQSKVLTVNDTSEKLSDELSAVLPIMIRTLHSSYVRRSL